MERTCLGSRRVERRKVGGELGVFAAARSVDACRERRRAFMQWIGVEGGGREGGREGREREKGGLGWIFSRGCQRNTPLSRET